MTRPDPAPAIESGRTLGSADPSATDSIRRQPGRRRACLVSWAVTDAVEFRRTMGTFPTGVAVVTATGTDGPAGLTTNAISALSLDPVLLLVCFDNDSRTLPVVRDAGRFAVNILRAGQEDLAAVFASKRVAREKFESVTHTVAHGVPVLDDALAWLACDLTEMYPAGDHTIGIGRVTQLEADSDGDPLLFFRGSYRQLAVDA